MIKRKQEYGKVGFWNVFSRIGTTNLDRLIRLRFEKFLELKIGMIYFQMLINLFNIKMLMNAASTYSIITFLSYHLFYR